MKLLNLSISKKNNIGQEMLRRYIRDMNEEDRAG